MQVLNRYDNYNMPKLTIRAFRLVQTNLDYRKALILKRNVTTINQTDMILS